MPSQPKPFIIPVFIPHLGCPHQCVFCNQRNITGCHSAPSQRRIRQHIEQFLTYNRQKRRPVQIAFFGGNFLGLPKDRMMGLLKAIHPFFCSKDVDSIRFSTRPETLNARTLALIRGFPVSTIELGAQSMDDRVLALSKRGHTSLATERAVFLLKKEAYEVGIQMMAGLPGDTDAGAISSGRKIAALRPDFVRIYPTLVMRNSELASWYARGRYSPLSLEKSVTLVKDLYILFQEHRIRVIRMGLQASDNLDSGEGLVAGPYHPSFGHLVLSEIMRDRIKALIFKNSAYTGRVTIQVHPKDVPQVQGLHKQNLHILEKELALEKITVQPRADLSAGQIKITPSA